jgi:hypothetical protein
MKVYIEKYKKKHEAHHRETVREKNIPGHQKLKETRWSKY